MKIRTFVIVSACCMWIAHRELEAQSATPDAQPAGLTVLFDGKTLDHFRGYQSAEIGKGWKIDNGNLIFDGSGGGDIMTKEKFSDFELSFDWKISAGGNSGVMYRVTTGDDAPYYSGPEYQILDDSKHNDGKNKLTAAASLYGLYRAEGKVLNPVGQWNSAKIVQRGNHVEHWLNGKKVVEAVIGSDDWKERVGDSKFRTWEKFGASQSGHIAFQDHGDKVWFRDIEIKSLK